MANNNTKGGKMLRRKIILAMIDFLIIFFSFLIFAWIKPATVRVYLPNYAMPFLFFSGVWLLVSLIISKYNLHKARKPKDVIVPVLIANLTILAVVTTLIYSFGAFFYSRLIVFGTILLSTLLEIVFAYLYFSYKRPVIVPEFDEELAKKPHFYPADKSFIIEEKEKAKYVESREQIRKIIVEESSLNVYDFISKYLDVGNPGNMLVSTTTQFNIDKLPDNTYQSVVNLRMINGIPRINKFFESVNTKLPFGGVYINSAETYPLRKERILKKYPPVINHIYYFFDYIFTTCFPQTTFN